MVFDAEVAETDDLNVRAGGKVVECGEEGEVGLEGCFLLVGETGVVLAVAGIGGHGEDEDGTETRTGITEKNRDHVEGLFKRVCHLLGHGWRWRWFILH